MNEEEFQIIQGVAATLTIKGYLGNLYEDADLYTTGWQALLEGYAKFGRGIHIYRLKNIIRRRMIDHIRQLRRRVEHHMPRVSCLTDLSEDDCAQLDIESQVDHSKRLVLDNEDFEHMLRMLSKRERNIVLMYVQQDLSMREIAQILNVTESRVCQIIRNDIAPLLAKTTS